MNRITNKDIENLVTRLNVLTNNPTEYSTTVDGKFQANIGNYHTSGAYGGIKLHQTMNHGGGVNVISNNGYGTKRELYNFLTAYISGLELKLCGQ